MSRDRSHQLPHNKKPHGGAKAGLSKDTEPCGAWHSLRMEGGEGRGVSFLKEKPCVVWLVRDRRT